MATQRAQRLARAIEALSARDMQNFVAKVTLNLGLSDSTKLGLILRLLQYAETVAPRGTEASK